MSPIASATGAPSTRLPAHPADNFGFTFEYGVCYLESLDTFQHTFRREVRTDPAITATVTLTSDQMRIVYDKLVEIDFFNYPSQYIVPTPESRIVGISTPAYRYHLTVRNAGVTHSVSWEDNIFADPMPQAATQLRVLFTVIRDIVQAYPDVQSLPPPQIGCV